MPLTNFPNGVAGAAPVSVTSSTLSATADDHGNRVSVLSRAAGITVTLPAATGTGITYKFLIGTTVTSNSTVIKVANSTDVMTGLALSAADGGGSVNGWETAADTDTITFDGSTTGGIKGDMVALTSVASGLWYVSILSSSTGTEATPFSATV